MELSITCYNAFIGHYTPPGQKRMFQWANQGKKRGRGNDAPITMPVGAVLVLSGVASVLCLGSAEYSDWPGFSIIDFFSFPMARASYMTMAGFNWLKVWKCGSGSVVLFTHGLTTTGFRPIENDWRRLHAEVRLLHHRYKILPRN